MTTTTSSTITPVTIGTGPDSLILTLAEDAYLGNAQFTISIDGVQIGGIQTATASHALGQSQAFTVNGSFGTGEQTISIDFINDLYAGSASTDRNLYVDTITDGATKVTENAALYSNGTQSFNVAGTAAPVTIGTGPDSFVLGVAEDAYLGNAQFTIAIDGVQVGGVQTATAIHGAGQVQDFTVNGSFGAGPHTVSVDFINDAYGGSATTDRNMYVSSISYDGTTTAEDAALMSDGTQSFQILGAAAPTTVGSGPDSMTVTLSEDAYLGNAQFTISVDGVQIGGVQTATALHDAGQTQTFTLHGNFGTGPQTVAVDFLNDAYAGTSSTDRNLYVGSVTYDGTTTAENAALYSAGTQTFTVPPTAPPTVSFLSEKLASDTGASGSDLITSDGAVTLSGTETGSSGTTVTVYDGSEVLGQATLDGKGGWTYSTTLGSGAHTLHAAATDPAGNMAQTTSGATITVVGATPSVLLGAEALSANMAVQTATAAVAAVSTTTVASPAAAGTMSIALASGGTAPVPNETISGGSFATGVNLSGMEYNGSATARPNYDYAVPTQAELAYYHSQGTDLIRLPISWETLQPTLGGPLNQTYLSEIKGVVNEAAALGMKVIIDMHDYGGYNGQKIGGGTVTDANFANVWTQLATAFAGNSGIAGYDLMNEPNGMPNAQAWPDAAQAAITAIRKVDTSSAIYVEGDDWSSAGDWSQVNGGLASLVDPSNNLIFSAHVYLDNDNSGTHFDWAQQAAAGDTTQLGVERLSNFVAWLQANNLKGDVGEIGAGNDSAEWIASLNNTLAYAKANNLQVTYWAGGPWLGSYAMSVEPTNGVAAPQMAVLDAYSGAVATVTSAALTGTAAANSTVYLSENGVLLTTATANASGVWSDTLKGLANGIHTIVAGNTPPANDGTISALSFDLEAPTATVASYTVNLTGTVQSSVSSKVELFAGNTDLGAATVGANGAWSYSGTLATGTFSVSAVATDLAGNTSTTALTTLESGTSGNDTLSTTAGNNLLSGNGGSDVYKLSAADTVDTIVNGVSGRTAASGELDMAFASGQLWFAEVGNNLVIDVLGTGKQAVIQNWLTGAGSQLSKIVGSDSLTIDTGVQSLVQAMATFSAANSGFNPLSTMHNSLSDSYFGSTVQAAVGTAWHK